MPLLKKDELCLYTPAHNNNLSVYPLMDTAVKLGIPRVELFNLTDELRSPDIAEARKIAKYAREREIILPCLSVGIDLISLGNNGVESLKRYVEIASELEIPYLHHTIAMEFSGGSPLPSIIDERFIRGAEYALILSEHAHRHGVRTIVENQGFVFNGREQIRRLYDLSGGRIGILADLGNCHFVGEGCAPMILDIREGICHAHIKDYYLRDTVTDTKGWYRTKNGYLCDAPICEGDIDLARDVQALRDIGYRGYFSIELPAYQAEDVLVKTINSLTIDN